jgi:hypothetical protein
MNDLLVVVLGGAAFVRGLSVLLAVLADGLER